MGAAAVLSPRAAALFGLEVLADEIGDLPGNRTRFLVLRRPGATGRAAPRLDRAGVPMRTTLVMAVRNEPGTLLAALRVFAEHGLNMQQARVAAQPRARLGVRLLGRPRRRRRRRPATQAALDGLRAVTTMVRVLGSYPRADDGV